MIHLDSEDLSLLKALLKKYPYTFYAYGSRVKGNYKKFSDLDLCIMERVEYTEIVDLKDELDDSNLPIKVDIKRWNEDMDEDFHRLIQNDFVLVQAGGCFKSVKNK